MQQQPAKETQCRRRRRRRPRGVWVISENKQSEQARQGMNNEPGSQAEPGQARPGQAQGAAAKTEPKTEARALVQCSEIKKPTNSSRKVVNKVSTMRTTTNPATTTGNNNSNNSNNNRADNNDHNETVKKQQAGHAMSQDRTNACRFASVSVSREQLSAFPSSPPFPIPHLTTKQLVASRGRGRGRGEANPTELAAQSRKINWAIKCLEAKQKVE